MDDDKIEKALQAGLSRVHPSPRLLNRIKMEADRQGWSGIPSRPGFWTRLRADSVLEFVAVCIVVVSLVGFGVYRNMLPGKVPAGVDHGPNHPGQLTPPVSPQCTDVPMEPEPEPGKVAVFFTCTGDTLPATPRAVLRDVPANGEGVQTALEELLKGPNDAEQALGFTSSFSSQTAGMLNSVTVIGGQVVVDFKDFRDKVNNASTTAGARQLLQELRRTVFQFDEIEEAQFQFDGNCDAFFQWLQSSCVVITAADFR